jgi:diguanylate cyclase (GGDEF)-like protein
MTVDVVLLTVLAGVAIRMAALRKRVRELEEQTITDPLTGAFNRRHLHRILITAIERRRRSGERASLVLFDIDRFKDVNDTLGHGEGDRILKALVALIEQRFRRLDALFRVGGEEFILLLTGARLVDATAIAEELRRLVQDARLVAGWEVSISLGVAELAPEQSIDEWIAEADAALYRAKRSGRNRVSGAYGEHPRFGATHPADNRLQFPARIS